MDFSVEHGNYPKEERIRLDKYYESQINLLQRELRDMIEYLEHLQGRGIKKLIARQIGAIAETREEISELNKARESVLDD